MQVIESRRATNTRRAYTEDLKKWALFCSQRGFDMGEPTLPASILFRDELKEHGYSDASIHRILACLSLIYRAFMANGLVQRNPFDSIILPRPELSRAGKTEAIDDAVVAKLLRVVSKDKRRRGRRDYAIIRLLYDTGMRRMSVASLLRSDLKYPRAWITVKGGHKEPVVFIPETISALKDWLRVAPHSPYVFPSKQDKESPIELTVVNQALTRRCKEAKIEHLHPHQFRATFITAAYDSGTYERDIQRSVHHVNAETTRLYDRGQRGDNVTEAVAKRRRGNA